MNLIEIIKRFGDGTVADEFESYMKRAAKECVLKDAKSSVTLKLEFTPNEQSGVIIGAKLALAVPSQTHARTFMFLDDDGELTTQPPDQKGLRENRAEFAGTGVSDE